jgi:hypothetical protein
MRRDNEDRGAGNTPLPRLARNHRCRAREHRAIVTEMKEGADYGLFLIWPTPATPGRTAALGGERSYGQNAPTAG